MLESTKLLKSRAVSGLEPAVRQARTPFLNSGVLAMALVVVPQSSYFWGQVHARVSVFSSHPARCYLMGVHK